MTLRNSSWTNRSDHRLPVSEPLRRPTIDGQTDNLADLRTVRKSSLPLRRDRVFTGSRE